MKRLVQHVSYVNILKNKRKIYDARTLLVQHQDKNMT